MTGADTNAVSVETLRAGEERQVFLFANHGTYWESVEEIPEPHEFDVVVTLEQCGGSHVFETRFADHDHAHDDNNHQHAHDHEPDPARDPLYAPLRGTAGVRRIRTGMTIFRRGRIPCPRVRRQRSLGMSIGTRHRGALLCC